MKNGAIWFSMGVVITIGSALALPGFVLFAYGLLLTGLFYLLYGLLVSLSGYE